MNNQSYNNNTIEKAIKALDSLKEITFTMEETLKKLWPSIKASYDKGNSAKIISTALNKSGIKCNDIQIQDLINEQKTKKKNIRISSAKNNPKSLNKNNQMKVNPIDKNIAEPAGENNQEKK